MNDPNTADEVISSECMRRIARRIEEEKQSMRNNPTACLWLMYIDMVTILQSFIKAERTGNWELHLQTVHDMLPYFAAAGHNLYTKSAYLYLQKMTELKEDHPDVYKNFMEGSFVLRRTDRYWAGLSSDLVIEQVLMRNLKTSGGLTRGRGMTENQRLLWLLSMPSCAEINFTMQELTGTLYQTSEQHKESCSNRKKRDIEDTFKILAALKEWNPFSQDLTLHSIVNGITADNKVNVHKAKDVGQAIIESMVGKNVYELSFVRKRQAITLASRTSVVINNEPVQVDPQLMFQRLSLIATRETHENPALLFKYELCSHPPALFDKSSLPRVANKPALADEIWDLVKHEKTVLPTNVYHVIDGGALLQRVPWPRGYTVAAICKLYVDYVKQRYQHCTIVFDGYEEGPTTKDPTHQRRAGGSLGPVVNFTSQTVMKLKKDLFLNNTVNKQKFINVLHDAFKRDRLHHTSCKR